MRELSKKDIEELREMLKYDCEYSGTRDVVSEIVEETLKGLAKEGLFEDITLVSLVNWDGDEMCELDDFIEVLWDKAVEKILNSVEEQLKTDYDVKKVIEKLFDVAIERYGNDGGMGGEMVVNLDDAVEIVKAGGIDE